VRPGGPEVLKAALKRSLPIILILVLIGAVGFNVLRQTQGPRHAATARVMIADTDLGAMLAGIDQPFVDHEELVERELALAASPELARRVAQSDASVGDAEAVDAAATVDTDDGVLAFTATTGDPERSIRTANLLASEYIEWRIEISGAAIATGISQIEAEIARTGATRDLREKLNTLRLLETLNSGNATLFEEARSAPKTSPAPVRDSLVGGAIGLVVALLLVGVREAFSTRVRSDTEVEEILELPVLGTVATFPKRAKLVMFGRHQDTFADTYALLAANVVQSRNGTGKTVLAITSAVANEGKTLTSSNLAVALALRGEDVIVADLDLRKPSIATVFRLPEKTGGVVQALAGEADVDDLLWRVSLREDDPETARTIVPPRRRSQLGSGPPAAPTGSLHVLASGGSVRSGAAAHSARLPALLAELRARADVVLLDTPPALQAAEMAELSRHVDGVVVVVRQRTATHRSLKSLSRQAQTWPTRLVGAVVTDAETGERSYYFGR
jgi:polysaccharide biosynthesis transport protein